MPEQPGQIFLWQGAGRYGDNPRLPTASATKIKARTQKPVYIDLFAGCGGLSLGLKHAGWKGLFAIEKNPDAFSTLRANLIDDKRSCHFAWPNWLDVGPHEIGSVIRRHREQLRALRGDVDLIVGGPPCQGFSSAGRRDPDDPRNRLFARYLEIVKLVQPRMLLVENVRGITSSFGDHSRVRGYRRTGAYSEVIRRRLAGAGYQTFPALLRASEFGVPQLRPRYFIVGVRKELASSLDPRSQDPFADLDLLRGKFLRKLGLSTGKPVTVREAISDLRIGKRKTEPCVDSKGFQQISYRGPLTQYQRQMHGNMNGHAPNSLRLARHSPEILQRFDRMIRGARRGVTLTDEERARYGVKKMTVVVLDPARPSHTLTTLPDDLVHYAEPRIMTVREYARIQSFPDTFAFHGCYTTGGERRKRSCPRYTQVGNAVPPRLGEFIGMLLMRYRAGLPHAARSGRRSAHAGPR